LGFVNLNRLKRCFLTGWFRQPNQLVFQSPRLKTCISLFDIRPDSPRSATERAERGAGLWPTVADEIKHAGFLEGEAIETLPPIRL